MTNVSRLPCPFVDCQSSDAFSWDTDKACGKCHSCGNGYPSRKPTFDWASEEYPTEWTRKENNVMQSQTPTNLSVVKEEFLTPVYRTMRSISDKTMQFYSVKTYVNADGESIRQEYVYPKTHLKLFLNFIRNISKDF